MSAVTERVQVAGVEVSPDHFIGGERVASGRRFEDISPIDGEVMGEISRAGEAEVDLAVRAARDAFPQWADLGPAGRAPYLRRLADLIDENVDRLAAVENADMAMLLRSLRARVISRGARNYRSYADLAVAHEERDWASNSTLNRVIRMPAGPAVVITPWNAPFMLSTWKTAPALAAGCTVVLKPAEWSPLSCSLLGDLVAEAGIPPGVFNVVQGVGEEAGAALVAHPLLRRVSFTGSPETGRLIGVSAARNLVPFTAELGGKGPLVVFEDADLDAAASRAAGEDETTVSPLIHPDHLARVEGFVDRAREDGQKIVRGGRRSDAGPLFYEPTLIEPTSNDAEVVQNEVFGPVLTFQTFADEDEAVALANSTPYGLSGIVYTSSMGRADRVGRGVRAGVIWVNTFLVRDLTAPFGGMGISGIGREGGDYALDFYSDLKTLQVLEGTVG